MKRTHLLPPFATLSPSIAAAGSLLLALLISLWLTAPNALGACSDDPVPPDNSQVDQYTETLPDACGDQPDNDEGGGGDSAGGASGGGGSGGGGGASGGSSDPPVSNSTVEELQSLGPNGADAANLALSTSGGGGNVDSKGATKSGSASLGAIESEGGSEQFGASPDDLAPADGSAFQAIADAFGSDDGGAGPLLPILMVLVLLGALIGGLVRRFRSGGSTVPWGRSSSGGKA